MTVIPLFQAMPPAGHEAIAYRPACRQVIAQVLNNKVQWGVTMPDGTFYQLTERQPEPTKNAHAALDASGLCKVNGAIVPIVHPSQAVATSRPVVENLPIEEKFNVTPILLIGVSVFGVGTIVILMNLKDKDRQAFLEGQ